MRNRLVTVAGRGSLRCGGPTAPMRRLSTLAPPAVITLIRLAIRPSTTLVGTVT